MTATTSPVPTEVEDARARYARAQRAFQAGEITRDEIGRALDECMNTLTELSVTHRPALDCPPWCNDHQFFWGEDPDEGHSIHGHKIEGDGWEVTIDADRDGLAATPNIDAPSLSLSGVREYAHAILRACDAVEGSK